MAFCVLNIFICIASTLYIFTTCLFHSTSFSKSIYLDEWFSTGDNYAPRGYLAMSGDIFGCQNWGWGGELLAFTG